MSNQWTIERATSSYQSFRKEGDLEQGTWFDPYRHRACALGAFFEADDKRVAVDRGCVTNIMPRWLVHITPPTFDHQETDDAFAWADALYAPEGLIERANTLPIRARKAVWANAEGKLKHELRTNKCLHKDAGSTYRNFVKARANASTSTLYHLAANCFFDSTKHMAQLAGTVITCIEQALEEARV